MRGSLSSGAFLVLILVIFGAIMLITTGRFGPIGDQSGYGNGTGIFKIVYDAPQKAAYVQMEQYFKQTAVFETIANSLTSAYSLPKDLEIHLLECGEINCFWDTEKDQLLMCYEMMEYIPQVFQNAAKDQAELEKATGSSILFIFFHELGHGLIDLHKLPITGKEEDAVDQLSTLIMLEAGEEGEEAAIYGAAFFGISAAQNIQGAQDIPYWDTHSLDAQRFYNILCWVYGKDPQKYASLVTDGTLPEQRAVYCPGEYQQIKTSWETLLKPYEKNS